MSDRMFVLAHITDPHLAPLPAPRCSELRSKRLGGFINWQRKRRDIHLLETLEQTAAEVKRQRADHIAVTGDLVNLSLPEEFPAARTWLNNLGPARDVTFFPAITTPMCAAWKTQPRATGRTTCWVTASRP